MELQKCAFHFNSTGNIWSYTKNILYYNNLSMKFSTYKEKRLKVGFQPESKKE